MARRESLPTLPLSPVTPARASTSLGRPRGRRGNESVGHRPSPIVTSSASSPLALRGAPGITSSDESTPTDPPPRRLSWSDVCPITSFMCPISGRLLDDPVVTADGHTYERSEIESWFKAGKRTSPLTGAPLPHLALVRNHALRKSLNEYMERLKAAKPFEASRGDGGKGPISATVRDVLEGRNERLQELESEIDDLRQAVARVEIEKATLSQDLAFIERRFEDRAKRSERKISGSRAISVGSGDFVDSLPPWLRRLAVIGGDLEAKLGPTPLLSQHQDRGDRGSDNKGMRPESLLSLRMLFEDELALLSDEALRRAVRRQESASTLACSCAASEERRSMVIENPSTPLWTSDAAEGVAARVLEVEQHGSQTDFAEDASEAAAATLASELNALSALYDASRGASWNRRTGWGTDPEPGRWEGLALAPDSRRVVEILLPFNGLRGTLPCQLGLLHHLVVLDLSNNALTGPLPPQLAALTDLRTLNLMVVVFLTKIRFAVSL